MRWIEKSIQSLEKRVRGLFGPTPITIVKVPYRYSSDSLISAKTFSKDFVFRFFLSSLFIF